MSHKICKTTNLYDCTYGCKNPWVIYTCRMGIVVNAVLAKIHKKKLLEFLNDFKYTAVLRA